MPEIRPQQIPMYVLCMFRWRVLPHLSRTYLQETPLRNSDRTVAALLLADPHLTASSHLYPRHTGGAMAIRFLVITAITVVTPPVYFLPAFPYPSHMCFSSRCYWWTSAESRRNHGGVTADMATPLLFDSGATAISGGRTAVLAAALRDQWGATACLAVLLRGYCSGAAPWCQRGGYIWGVVFGCNTVFAAAENVANVITVTRVASHLARSDIPSITCIVACLSWSDIPTYSDQWQCSTRAAIERRLAGRWNFTHSIISRRNLKHINPKNTKKSPFRENANANITCNFCDRDISCLGVAYLTHAIHRYIHT